ncbi:MAG: PAS domain S-box protein [Desulfobacteraceae bacterium]
MKKIHLSTYMSLTITILVACATFLTAAVLYFNMKETLTTEFEDKVTAEAGQAMQVMKNQFAGTENRLNEITIDNTIRVTLMLGGEQQLQEYFKKKYQPDPDTLFFISPVDSKKIYSASEFYFPETQIENFFSRPGNSGKILKTEHHGFVYSVAQPIFRQKIKIGTALGIYVLNKNKIILNPGFKDKNDTIIMVKENKAWDLLTGKRIENITLPDKNSSKGSPFHGSMNQKQIAAAPLSFFPDLLYISHCTKLQEETTRVLSLVFYTSMAVLVFTFAISCLLSRLLTHPLSNLSNQSLQMARGRSEFLTPPLSSSILEIDQLMTSLSAMVESLKKTESLKRYQQLFDGVTDPVLIYDFSGMILECNEIAANTFGFKRQNNETSWLADSIHKHRYREILTELKEQKENQVFETEMVTQKGEVIFVEFHAKTIDFMEQKAGLSVIRNITDRKKTEEALKRSGERLALALEVSMASAWELNLKTFDFQLDSNLLSAFGFDPSEFPRKITDILKFADTRTAEKIKHRFNEFVEGKNKDYKDNFHIYTKSGEKRWIHNRARIVKFDQDQTPLIIIGAAIDMSELKRTEQTLRENEERYRTILENRNMGYFEVDLKGNFTFFNSAIISILGYPAGDLTGMNYKKYIDEDTADKLKKRYRQVLTTGKTLTDFQYPLIKQDGTKRMVETSVSLRKDINQQVVGFCGLTYDITERKKTEQEKKALEIKLRQSHKMEAIGTLAGGIAHDFNNILSGVFGYAQLAEKNIETPLKAREYIRQILKGARRAAELIQQILTFSRQSEHEKSLLTISVVVKEALKLLRSSIPTTIEIREKIVSNAPVMADSTQIHQVIMNLCTNAYHAMRFKGGIITVELTETDIEAQTGLMNSHISPGRFLNLRVSDTGEGMSRETLNKIFDPYFTTKNATEGTGLGLSLVYGIVEDHGGFIRVKSDIDKGTTFDIFLPVTEKKTDPPVEINKMPVTGRGSENIIIVDDEESVLLSTKELLEDYGYKIKAFSNGVDAFNFIKKEPYHFDLLITDMTMPHMSGDELAEKSLDIRKDLKIILCTGYSENMSEARAREIGIRQFLQKPFNTDRLLSIVRSLLDQKDVT